MKNVDNMMISKLNELPYIQCHKLRCIYIRPELIKFSVLGLSIYVNMNMNDISVIFIPLVGKKKKEF